MTDLIAGQEFRVDYPFIRDTYYVSDEDGGSEHPTWRPGCRYEPSGRYGEDTEAVCDGRGKQILTVVDTHKPGKYPTRVFYTIAWVDPDGRQFGKGKLHIATVDKFRRRTHGFMSHDFFFTCRLSVSEAAE